MTHPIKHLGYNQKVITMLLAHSFGYKKQTHDVYPLAPQTADHHPNCSHYQIHWQGCHDHSSKNQNGFDLRKINGSFNYKGKIKLKIKVHLPLQDCLDCYHGLRAKFLHRRKLRIPVETICHNWDSKRPGFGGVIGAGWNRGSFSPDDHLSA